ncbi:MAG: hypothetical protein ACPHRE_15435, partial [Pseudomonadales bacterium]
NQHSRGDTLIAKDIKARHSKQYLVHFVYSQIIEIIHFFSILTHITIGLEKIEIYELGDAQN